MHTQFISHALVLTTLALVALAAAQSLRTSTTGSCAGNTAFTCLNSRWGNCCSQNGFCGTNETYCGSGCQTGFGACYPDAGRISEDGSCGASANGITCLGSISGNCCSLNGFCGRTNGHCGDGCQSQFGACGVSGNVSNIVIPTVIVSVGVTSTVVSLSTVKESSSVTAASSTASSSSATVVPSTGPTSTAQAQVQSRPVTDTTGFKAGIAVAAVVLAAVVGALIWFFAVRQPTRRREQPPPQYHDQFTDKSDTSGASILYHEKEGTVASQSKSELGGFPVSELPASYPTIEAGSMGGKAAFVDERVTAGYGGAYRGH